MTTTTRTERTWACWLLLVTGRVVRLTTHATMAEAGGALAGHRKNLHGNRHVADLWIDAAAVDMIPVGVAVQHRDPAYGLFGVSEYRTEDGWVGVRQHGGRLDEFPERDLEICPT